MDYKNPDTLRAMSQTMSDYRIAKQFGITNVAIRYWRRKFNIPVCPAPNPGSTKFEFDRSYFKNIDTPEKAYILGFIIADGCVRQDGRDMTIAIKEEDVDLLVAIRDAIGSTAPIHTKHCTKGYGDHRLSVLHVCGVELVRDLVNLGVLHNKTTTATYPPIPYELDSHLIRGLIDGDGSIQQRHFSFIGTEPLVDSVRDTIMQHTGCQLTKGMVNGHCRIVGYKRDRSALVWIFKGATLALKRKSDIYQRYWD